MRKAWKRAGRTLATVAGLSWTTLALGQVSQELPRGPKETAHAASGLAQKAKAGRLDEIKVELAWMSDPAVFPYGVGARADDTSLEVRGFVPNQAVREQALRLARENTTLNVVDGLKIHANLPLRDMGESVEAVGQSAEDVLHEAFGDRALAWHVLAKGTGQVIVTGAVASMEEKLAVSVKLRRVKGCLSVTNQLTLPALAVAKRAPALPVSQTQGTTATVTFAEPMTPVKVVPARVEPAIIPWAGKSAVVTFDAPPAPKAVAPAIIERPKIPASVPMSVNPVTITFDAPVVPKATVPVRTEIAVIPASPPKPVVERTSPPSILPPVVAPLPPPLPVQPVPEWKPVAPAILPSMPKPMSSLPATPLVPTKAPESMAVRTHAPPVHVIPSPIQQAGAWTPSPTPTATPLAELPRRMPSAPVETPATPVEDTSYVTTGIVSFGNVEPARIPQRPAPVSVPVVELVRPKQVARLSVTETLKKAIEHCCGAMASDLTVTQQADWSVEVSFKVYTAEAGQTLGPKILALPELVPYKVALKVDVVD